MTVLASLAVSDRPDLWRELGFEVVGQRCRVGEVLIELGCPGRGVVGWELRGAGDLAEVPTAPAPGPGRSGPGRTEHPNGVVGVDHVVISTPDLDRTVAAFEQAGLPSRRTRRAGTPDRPLAQVFFRMVNTVVEVVGTPGQAGPGPAGFYGLAFTVADLDSTAATLGWRLRPPRDAVQEGRRIATLDRAAGSAVPLAFMSPRPA